MFSHMHMFQCWVASRDVAWENLIRLASSTTCHNPTLKECEDETHTLETWESFGTLETLDFDCRGQNTSYLGVL
jgi:hypothetical protein